MFKIAQFGGKSGRTPSDTAPCGACSIWPRTGARSARGATILADCGFRPEECYRLKWENIKDGGINIHQGKGRGSRRRIPCTQRVRGILEMRAAEATTEWVFPAQTKRGHIETSTLKKRHAATLAAADVSRFMIYDLRHTCITRWAKILPLPMVQKLAGHTSVSTNNALRTSERCRCSCRDHQCGGSRKGAYFWAYWAKRHKTGCAKVVTVS